MGGFVIHIPQRHSLMPSISKLYGIFFFLTDLLHIEPAPNNGTHGSLNHLLKTPFYKPSHAGELSTPADCGFTTPLPTDPLDCSCPALQNVSDNFMSLQECKGAILLTE